MDLNRTAPNLCAGNTMYSPLAHWGATTKKNMHIGILEIGGLRTMGLKLAKTLGHTVYAISFKADKEQLAKSKGANDFILSSNDSEI